MNAINDIVELIHSDYEVQCGRFGSWKKDLSSALMAMQLSVAFEATFLYRLSHVLFIADKEDPCLPFLANMMRMRTGAEIYYSNRIGPRFNVQHGTGIVIGPNNVIGADFTIHQGVTIGQSNLNRSSEAATIGSNVTVFANAIVLGSRKIADGVTIGAGAVLCKDADQPGGVYVGVPATLHAS